MDFQYMFLFIFVYKSFYVRNIWIDSSWIELLENAEMFEIISSYQILVFSKNIYRASFLFTKVCYNVC